VITVAAAAGDAAGDAEITAVTRFDASRLRTFGLPGILGD
jgi:hypothetical protein